jgi:hypothetical protein
MRFITVFAALAAAVAAYTPPIVPDYSKSPSGNSILTPGLNQLVPQGAPFEITWTPTTAGTVTLILLRGPSYNVIPIATIANEIPNSGSFTWTPTGLTADTTGYGILLVVTSDKSYQYSTQFGIGPGAAPVSSPPSTSSVATGSMPPAVSGPAVPPSTFVKTVITTTYCPESAVTSASMPMGTGTVSAPFSSTASPTVPAVKPSGAPTSPVFPGAADRNMVSFGGLAVMAGVAAVLAF